MMMCNFEKHFEVKAENYFNKTLYIVSQTFIFYIHFVYTITLICKIPIHITKTRHFLCPTPEEITVHAIKIWMTPVLMCAKYKQF